MRFIVEGSGLRVDCLEVSGLTFQVVGRKAEV
jgi:hypothetical protein